MIYSHYTFSCLYRLCVCTICGMWNARNVFVRCSTHLPRKFCKLSNIQSINNIVSFSSNFTCCSPCSSFLAPLSVTVTVSLYHYLSLSHLGGAYSLCTSHFITLLNYVFTLFLLLLYLTLTFVNCWLTFSWVSSSFCTRSVSLRLCFTSHFTTHTERQRTVFDRVVVPPSAISRWLNRSACATHNFKLAARSRRRRRRRLASIVAAHSGCVRRFRQTKRTASANSFIKLIAHKLNKQ